jgi:hypothetical protein
MRQLVTALVFAFVPVPALVSAEPPEDRLRDRDEGTPLSMFGTQLREGELVIYPFFEYYRDGDYE